MTETGQYRLEARGLACVRNDEPLFEGLDFTVNPGELYQFDGPNGCGKTSLLRILCGLSQPESGEVLWCGENALDQGAGYLEQLAYVGHAHGVKRELTPRENLNIARALSGRPGGLDAESALAHLGLAGYEDTPARNLSAGQSRRVGLARLLATRSRLWILDEPFTAVDRQGIGIIERMLEEHLEADGMIILTSHQTVNVGAGHTTSIHLAA